MYPRSQARRRREHSLTRSRPTPEDDEEAARLSIISLLCIAGVTVVSAGLALLVRNHVDAWVKIEGFSKYLWLLPLGIAGLGTYEVLSQWAARTKSFAVIGKTSAQRSLLQVAAQLGAGFAGFGATGLVVGQLLGQWSGTFVVARRLWQRDRDKFRAVRLRELPRVARQYRRYPLLTVPAALLHALDANAAPLLFAYFFARWSPGHSRSATASSRCRFVDRKLGQKVFLPAASEAKHAGRWAEETEQMYRRCCAWCCRWSRCCRSARPTLSR